MCPCRTQDWVCSFFVATAFRTTIESDSDLMSCSDRTVKRLRPRITPPAPYPPIPEPAEWLGHPIDWEPVSPTQPYDGPIDDDFLRPSQGAIVPFVEDRGANASDRRQTYLITYSQADPERYPTRAAFAEIVLEAFRTVSDVEVIKYAVAKEPHKRAGMHYHMSVKLSKQARYKAVADYLRHNFKVNVNFSTNHSNYQTAYEYVRRDDPDALLSLGHEPILVPPRTTAASERRQQASKGSKPPPAPAGPKRLRKEEVAKIIVDKNLRSESELKSFATKYKRDGEDDRLYNFIVSMAGNKGVLESLIRLTWELENAPEEEARAKKSRLDILVESKSAACVCGSRWKVAAREILRWNEIRLSEFQDAVITAIRKGRGKGRNIMLIGRANCGKTFLFEPLTRIFHCFESPASGSFAWVGVEHKELVFLNDYRWTPAQIPWANFLTFLEGATTQIPAPKTSRDKDIEFTRDVPVFATAQRKVLYDADRPKAMGTPELLNTWREEQEMMDVRWKIFELKKPIENREEIKSCPRCFAQFILDEIDL